MTDRKWSALSAMKVERDDALFLDRLRLFKTPWFGVYWHVIHRPDLDPDPHDHPWWFLSIVLSGEYDEQLWSNSKDHLPVSRTHRRFRPMFISRKTAHAITEVRGCLWTIVLTGPDHDDWRFWTKDGPVPWREYLERSWLYDGTTFTRKTTS